MVFGVGGGPDLTGDAIVAKRKPAPASAECWIVAIGIVRLSDGGATNALVRGQDFARLLMAGR